MVTLCSLRQLQGELELAGIESCRRFLTAVPKRIHVGHIETVDDVESVHYAFESEPVAEGDALGNPDVREDVFGLDSRIPPQIARQRAIEEASWLQETCWREARSRGLISAAVGWRSGGHNQRTIGGRTEMEVGVV